ncbi:hypothetical protein J2T17_002626 [Paenibacillus mucilaginosus]
MRRRRLQSCRLKQQPYLQLKKEPAGTAHPLFQIRSGTPPQTVHQ